MTSPGDSSSPARGTSLNGPPGENASGQSVNQRDRNGRKRVRHFTADERAAHRVFERSRREAFKDRLSSLAAVIPSLQSSDVSRLSKHVVLDESLMLHRAEQAKLDESAQRIDQLLAEREDLIAEVNRWRTGAGIELRQTDANAPYLEEERRDSIHVVPGATELEIDIGLIDDGLLNADSYGSSADQIPNFSMAHIVPPLAAQDAGASLEALPLDDLSLNMPLHDAHQGAFDLDGMYLGGMAHNQSQIDAFTTEFEDSVDLPFHAPFTSHVIDPLGFMNDPRISH
ncbi:hypothetical protein G7046_g3458 [Stylonectria norvegica]|nr:hypothetical protein G7046_g3458 [Stylonectria norvegica]